MKRMFTLIAAFCSLAIFAQSPSDENGIPAQSIPRNIKNTTKSDIYNIKNLSQGENRGASLAYYWVNFNDAIDEQYNGGLLENLAIVPIWQDSTVKVVGDDGTGPFEFYWWIHAFSSMLDPTSTYIADWVDNNYTLIGTARDWFNKNHSFVVDTIRFYYYYDRFDYTVTDTLKVWVMGPGSTAQVFGTLGDPPYNASYTKYVNETNKPNGTSTLYTFLLDDDDTASFLLRNIDIPVSIEIPKAPTGNGNKISLAWAYSTGQEYDFGDTLIDANTTPTVTDPLNRFWLLTNEELLDSEPISMDEGTFNQDGAATTEVRYDMSTTGWNGYYINTFAFLSPEYVYEHAYVDYHLAPKGANWLALEPSPCVDLTMEFNDLSNFVVDEGDATYYWDFDDDGSISLDQNPIHTFSEPGTYNVCLVVTEGSISFEQCRSVIVDYCVGIDEIENLIHFNIYPNPAKDILSLDLNFEIPQNANVTVRNLQGEMMYSNKLVNTINYIGKIDLSNFASGIYMIEIQSDNQISTKSFIVE